MVGLAYNGEFGAILSEVQKSLQSSRKFLSYLQLKDEDWRSEVDNIRLEDKDKELKSGPQGSSGIMIFIEDNNTFPNKTQLVCFSSSLLKTTKIGMVRGERNDCCFDDIFNPAEELFTL